jgi:osmotically-inducible protein OsmY
MAGIKSTSTGRELMVNASTGVFLLFAVLFGIFTYPVLAVQIDDKDITFAIEVELLNDESVPSRLIGVETDNGIVILSGSVDNLLAKEQAAKVAETVKGVRSVVNRITVKPRRIQDEQIRRLVQIALLSDPATDSYEVSVTLKGGFVTLAGTVGSWQEKELCGQVAKGINGVRGLQNNINVEYKTRWPDREIEATIQDRLKWDVWVDDTLIGVLVRDGRVTLSGKVASPAEKARAEADAWVSGVKSVDTSGLKFDWWMPDVMQRGRRYTFQSDAGIEKAIENAFRYDPRVKPFNAEVEVNDGVVTLTGVVDNLKAKKAAAEDAGDTVGVWRVENHLRVRPAKRPSDGEIQGNVQDALARNAVLDRHEITVSVLNGRAALYGEVDSRYEKSLAEDIASRVKGVTDVQNYLTVRSSKPQKSDWEIN